MPALTPPGAPLLSVTDLSVCFGRPGAWQPVVQEVGFEVAPGEALAIVGESGSGKSVTALAITRLLPPGDSRVGGRVLLDGTDLLTLPERGMRAVRGGRIGMIFQEPMTSLNPVLTIGTQIGEALRAHRPLSHAQARQEARRLLDRVRIPGAARRLDGYPHQLSGGQRQRVMIAMALAGRPKLLIADEPTTALDVTVQAEILVLLGELQREDGMAVLFITHDLAVVAGIADRTLVMHRGRVVEAAPTVRLFAAPTRAYTRTLLDALPSFGSPGNRRSAAVPVAGAKDAAPVLRVSDLTVRYPVRSGLLGIVSDHVRAVERVSFEVGAGETLALVGESGCGKSTIGRTIMRLLQPQAGTIELESRDLARLDGAALRACRRRMQIVFQDPFSSLDPRQTVGAAIAEPLLAHDLMDRRAARAQAASLLTDVELDPAMAARLPHELSGGQRQRVCIARALALSPRLIVLDEAVTALDATVKKQVLDLLLRLQAEHGLSYLFISHDLSVVERISHRVAVMQRGELVEIGPTRTVLDSPRHAYTRRLLDAVPLLDPAHRRAARAAEPIDHAPPDKPWLTVAPGHSVRTNGLAA